MRVEATAAAALEAPGDLHVITLADGESLPDELVRLPGAADTRSAYRRRALLRPDERRRVLVLGAGDVAKLDAERLRVLAALAVREGAALEAKRVVWALDPRGLEPATVAAAIVEGAILAAYRFERFRGPRPDEPPTAELEQLTIATAAADELGEALRAARVASVATNRARELQDLPANVLTPTALAERARELAVAFEPVTVEVLGREELAERKLGGLLAVAAGSEQEPRLISLRYSGRGSGPVLGLVGKAVTFDSGGISIKPSARMQEMKMDMSGGAAVLEAVAAIAELGLQLDVVAVIPATENMPSGAATRPGDVITQLNGKTVEVNNTDAEGRLILADALTWCVRELGADRVLDVATLTGAVLVALGSTYAGLIANDDAWAAEVTGAAERTGELVWRLPLHDEYRQLTRGSVADLSNSSGERKAGTIYGGAFLEEFVDGKPWAHLDIAGTAWDVRREYVGKGATGFGVRLLVALARELAARSDPAR